MSKEIQLIHLRGGTTFHKYDDYLKYLKENSVSLDEKIRWHIQYLKKEIGDKFEIIKPEFPSYNNVKYIEWKIVFENYLKILDNKIILMGTSLGSRFIIKYLSENKIDKKILGIYLICPVFDDTLPTEDLGIDFKFNSDLDFSLIKEQCSNIRFFFSEDDDVVPIEHANKYMKHFDKNLFKIYESKNGHFQIKEFPEFVEILKKDFNYLNKNHL